GGHRQDLLGVDLVLGAAECRQPDGRGAHRVRTPSTTASIPSAATASARAFQVEVVTSPSLSSSWQARWTMSASGPSPGSIAVASAMKVRADAGSSRPSALIASSAAARARPSTPQISVNRYRRRMLMRSSRVDGSRYQRTAATVESSGLPSWGVKENPTLSFPFRTARLSRDTTAWLMIRPYQPWPRPNENTGLADRFWVTAMRVLAARRSRTSSRSISRSSVSEKWSECMYCVFSFTADENTLRS